MEKEGQDDLEEVKKSSPLKTVTVTFESINHSYQYNTTIDVEIGDTVEVLGNLAGTKGEVTGIAKKVNTNSYMVNIRSAYRKKNPEAEATTAKSSTRKKRPTSKDVYPLDYRKFEIEGIDKSSCALVEYSGNRETLIIPRTLYDIYDEDLLKAVVEIAEESLEESSAIKIVIPDTVEYIGARAFAHSTKLVSIAIPYSVKTIEEETFSGCLSLEDVYLPPSIISIGKEAFLNCKSLEKITLPPLVASIGERAFSGCESLKEISLPPLVASIGERAFSGCKSLKEISLPPLTESIAEECFSKCDSLEKIVIPPRVTKIDRAAFQGCVGLKELTTPPNIEMIGEEAFKGCKNLAKASFSIGLKTIKGNAFCDCSRLVSVSFPKSLVELEENAFYSCHALKEVQYEGTKEEWEKIKKTSAWMGGAALPDVICLDGAISTRQYKKIFAEATDASCFDFDYRKVPNIGDFAFIYDEKDDSYAITEYSGSSDCVIVPENYSDDKHGLHPVRRAYGFKFNSSTRYVAFPPSIKHFTATDYHECISLGSDPIGMENTENTNNSEGFWKFVLFGEIVRGVFSKGVEKVIFSEGTETIGNVFDHCHSLTTLILPKSLKSITGSSFYNCASLSKIILDPDNPYLRIVDGVLYDKDLSEIIIYPAKKKDAEFAIPLSVKSISQRCFISLQFLEKITIPRTVESIKDSTFTYCDKLKSVIFEDDGVKTIGSYSFRECPALENVKLPTGLEAIGESAFRACISLTSISIPETTRKIGNDAFACCLLLADATLPSKIDVLGDKAFQYCKSLREIKIPDGIESIGESLFDRCISLLKVTLPPSAKKIGKRAFFSCDKLEEVNFPLALVSIGEEAFRDCHSLKMCLLPPRVKEIGAWSFYGCSAIKELFLPKSLLSIGDYSFYFSSISTLTIPGNIKTIPDGAFDYCKKLRSIEIEEGVTEIDDYAFKECEVLDKVVLPRSLLSLGLECFLNSGKATEFDYDGDEESWKRITKWPRWNGFPDEEKKIVFLRHALPKEEPFSLRPFQEAIDEYFAALLLEREKSPERTEKIGKNPCAVMIKFSLPLRSKVAFEKANEYLQEKETSCSYIMKGSTFYPFVLKSEMEDERLIYSVTSDDEKRFLDNGVKDYRDFIISFIVPLLALVIHTDPSSIVSGHVDDAAGNCGWDSLTLFYKSADSKKMVIFENDLEVPDWLDSFSYLSTPKIKEYVMESMTDFHKVDRFDNITKYERDLGLIKPSELAKGQNNDDYE